MQPNHFHIIKFIGVKVGLQDVTPVAFEDIQKLYTYRETIRSSQILDFVRHIGDLKNVKLAIRHESTLLEGITLKYHYNEEN